MSFKDKIAEWSKQVMKSPGRSNQSINERTAELLNGYVHGSNATVDQEFRSCSTYLVGPTPNSSNLSRAAHVFAYMHENYNSTDPPNPTERGLYESWIANKSKEKQPEPNYRNVIRELVDGFIERRDTGVHKKFVEFVIYGWGPDPSSRNLDEAAEVFSFHETPTKGQPIPSTSSVRIYNNWKDKQSSKFKAVPPKEDSPAKLKAIESMKALTPDELGEVLDLFLLINDGPETEESPSKGSYSASSAGPMFTERSFNQYFMFQPPIPAEAAQEAFNKMTTKMTKRVEAETEAASREYQAYTPMPYYDPACIPIPAHSYEIPNWPSARSASTSSPQKKPESKSQESTQQSQEPKYAFKAGQSVWYKGPAKSEKTKGRILEIKGLKAIVRLGEDACAYNVRLVELEPAEEEV